MLPTVLRVVETLSETKLPLLRDQPSIGTEIKLLTWDRWYNDVLLGQGYRTHRGAMVDEHGAKVN